MDVSNPGAPSLRGRTSINGGSCYSIALSGNYVIAASQGGNLEVIDVTDPSSPADVGHASGLNYASSVAAAGGYVYAASSITGQGFYVFALNGSTLTQVGHIPSLASDGYNMQPVGGKVYMASRTGGLTIIDVSNPYNPTAGASFDDSGMFRQYNSVAVTGNAMPACGYPEGTLVGFNSIFNVSNPSAPTFAANPNAAGSSVLARYGIAYTAIPQELQKKWLEA